jgi:hypothetical protein
MDRQQLQALELAARVRIVFDGTAWLVPSQTTSTKDRVRIGEAPSCPCADFTLRQQPCKHIRAARLVCAREGGVTGPELVTDAVPTKPSYQQDWPLYNLAQTTEKSRFRELLFDLCQGVEQPPLPRTGRRPHGVEKALFAMAYKVYAGFSSRRFDTDLADAHAAGLLSVRIPGMKVCACFENAGFTALLHARMVRSSLPLQSVETIFAPDSTGFSTSRFVRWHDEKYGAERSGRDGVKAHAIGGVKTNVVTAVVIAGRDAGDSPQFKPLVQKTTANFTVQEVPADKAYLSHDNLALVAQLGGTA